MSPRWRLLLPALASACLSGMAQASKPIEYAARMGGAEQYWRVEGGNPTASDLEPGLSTPLGSVWKLFVYVYLADRGLPSPEYVCGGQDREEVYCCAPGQSVGREEALVRSCGLFFAPDRLGLGRAAWQEYWTALQAPAWLRDLDTLKPDTQVSVASLLAALASVPPAPRSQAGGTLLATTLNGHDPALARYFGGNLRAKTYSWKMGDQSVGGAAGWLADGTPVWLRGTGTSRAVLPQAAAALPDALNTRPGSDDRACVDVALFERYPLSRVENESGQAVAPGILRGRYRVRFANGNQLTLVSQGELLLSQALRLRARLSINEYVARVLEREAAPRPLAAARALAVAARTYLEQNAARGGDCLRIADSTATQRVSPSPAGNASRQIASWTDSLILSGVPVQYHRDQPEPNRMAWTQAVEWAERGAHFDEILARAYPGAILASTASPLATQCQRLPEAERWLATRVSHWRKTLTSEAGFEPPRSFRVCSLSYGRPHADLDRGYIYARGLGGPEARLTLVHEYLHLAFAHHPNSRDEAFIEAWARRLSMEGSP